MIETKPKALVVINPKSREGGAERRFASIRDRIESIFEMEVMHLKSEPEMVSVMKSSPHTFIIAAGGDGTVNAVVNAMTLAMCTDRRVFGAVGLGSSNDFHRPFGKSEKDIPLKTDPLGCTHRDLIRVRWETNQSMSTRMIVVSASIGLTSSANAFFNNGDRLLTTLKKRWVGGAFVYAAWRALLRAKPMRITLSQEGQQKTVEVMNISILKTPYLAGGLRFDTPIASDDGMLLVNISLAMSRLRLCWVMLKLLCGKFIGDRTATSMKTHSLGMEFSSPAVLELDGEIVCDVHRVSFEVIPLALEVCGNFTHLPRESVGIGTASI